MFHVKHTYFAGLKTLILSNTACLEPSFTLQRNRQDMLSFLHSAPIDTINSSPLQSPHKLSPRRLEWSFVFIERKLDGRTTRQYTPSTSLNIFIDKASPETTSQRTRVERLVPLQTHTAATHISADNKYSPTIKTAKPTKRAACFRRTAPQKPPKPR